MKVTQTFSLATLAATFNSVSAIENTSLVNEAGLIWNSDETLCLKMYGSIFPNQKQDFSHLDQNSREYKKAVRKQESKATCDHVYVGFSSDCKVLLDDGTYASEEDLPVEYKFRVSDHGDYFCIIGDGDGHPCSVREEDNATYKLTAYGKQYLKTGNNWKRNYFPSSQQFFFTVEPYGCPTCMNLNMYFKFQDETNKLIYGPFGPNMQSSYVEDNTRLVFWDADGGNYLNVKKMTQVEQTNLLAIAEDASADEPSCGSGDSGNSPGNSYNNYASFVSSLANQDDYYKTANFFYSSTNTDVIKTHEGKTFIFADRLKKQFVAAFKVPADGCIWPTEWPYVNFKVTILDNPYSARLDWAYNCENFNSPTSLTINDFDFTLYGYDILDEIQNGPTDRMKSDSEIGKSPVRFEIENLATQPLGLDWFVLDGHGVPTYVATIGS